jgi:2,3-bisphosphoglycerate-independent phosphoglycerate mutase
MDRDKKWDRERKAFDAMVHGKAEGGSYTDAVQGMKESYNKNVTDEFVLPFVVTDSKGEPIATIRDEDVVINFNFRADRARQITRCLARESGLSKEAGRDLPDWEALDEAIPRSEGPKNLTYICFTQYDPKFTLPMVIPPESLGNILANVMSSLNMRNLRVAETEKYAHVTYFFNGGIEKPFPGEDRVLVQSPKVATYDLQPEMSAAEVTDKLVAAVDSGKYDLIVVNYANPDMVGHSGILAAAIKAVEAVDECLGRLVDAVTKQGGVLLVTADHGNCELMRDPVTGGPHTAHTTNPVPVVLVADEKASLREGRLADIAPTLLELMGLPKPAEMTGTSLLKR